MTALPPDPWVVVGKIGKPVGLDGSVRIWSEAELSTILDNKVPLSVYLPRDGRINQIRLTMSREDGHGWVVKWEDCDSRDATVPFRNALVVAQRQDLPEPEEGLVYWSDLLGAEVQTREGRRLGVVVDLVDSPAHPVVEVQSFSGRRFLLPLSEEVDADLEPPTRERSLYRLVVNLLEGLEEATEVS